jgi:hypothetical protein
MNLSKAAFNMSISVMQQEQRCYCLKGNAKSTVFMGLSYSTVSSFVIMYHEMRYYRMFVNNNLYWRKWFWAVLRYLSFQLEGLKKITGTSGDQISSWYLKQVSQMWIWCDTTMQVHSFKYPIGNEHDLQVMNFQWIYCIVSHWGPQFPSLSAEFPQV